MKHQICEVCGASLDFGEKCDCEKIHSALPAASSDKPHTSLDMPKEVSGNVEIDLPAIDLSNPSAENRKTDSADFSVPAPMPVFIAEMISGLRAKA